MRSGIRSLLESSNEVDVVGEAENGREAIEKAETLRPHVVLMDVAMGDLNGIDATREIVHRHPAIHVLVLSMYGDEQYIFEALRAGAKGYILKSAAVKELLTAVREAAAGRSFVSPSLAGVVMADYVRRAKGEQVVSQVEKLTAREREVLQLIAEGHSNTEVARSLFISVRTVESHRQNIMEKLDIRTIAGLTRFAIKHRLSSLG